MNWITIISLGLLPVTWVPIFRIGEITFEVWYLPVLLLPLWIVTKSNTRSVFFGLLYRLRYFIFIYILWWVYICVSYVVHDTREGLVPLFRQLVSFMFFLALTTQLLLEKNLSETLMASAGVAGAAFIIFIVLSSLVAGIPLMGGIGRLFRGGDFELFLYQTLRPILNAHVVAGEAIYSAAMKNNINVLIYVLVIQCLATWGCKLKPWVKKIISVVVICLFIFGLFMSTRSVILSYLASGLFVFLALLMKKKSVIPMALMMALVSAIFIMILMVFEVGYLESFLNRVSKDTQSYGVRVSLMSDAMSAIENNYLFGIGYVQFNELDIHNLFLSSFLYAGVIGFILAVLLYLFILYYWFVGVRYILKRNKSLEVEGRNISIEWVACLPILILVRVWLSGSSGHISTMEWTGMAIYMAYLIGQKQRVKVVFK